MKRTRLFLVAVLLFGTQSQWLRFDAILLGDGEEAPEMCGVRDFQA